MKRIFWTIALLCLGVTGSHAEPLLAIDEPVWDLGILHNNKRYEKTVTLENAGTDPLIIEGIEQCCGFFGRIETPRTLLPGETASLELVVKLSKRIGDFEGTVYLLSNDPAVPRYPLTAFGMVAPERYSAGRLSTSSVDIGVVDLGDRVPFSVSILNTGNEPLEILKLEKPGTIREQHGVRIIPAGGQGELELEYVADAEGPIDERMVISTSSNLEKAMSLVVRGYVTRKALSRRVLMVHPVGKVIEYDPSTRSYHYDFVLENRSQRDIEVMEVSSSLPVSSLKGPVVVEAGDKAKQGIVFDLKPEDAPMKGHVYLNIAVPIEVR